MSQVGFNRAVINACIIQIYRRHPLHQLMIKLEENLRQEIFQGKDNTRNAEEYAIANLGAKTLGPL